MKFGVSIAVAAICLALGLAPAGAQDFDKGLAAARAGDFATALSIWRPLASNGNAEAQFNLGAIYEAGLGVPADVAEAAGWYALAAGQGHAKSQYNLGVMYADGRGVRRDEARAATWLRKAAEQDHGKAQYNLAVLYQFGRGLPKDPEQAKVWFERAAANGIMPDGENTAEASSEAKPAIAEDNAEPSDEPAGEKFTGLDETVVAESSLPVEKGSPPETTEEPAAAKATGLNLHEFGLDAPAEPPAANKVATDAEAERKAEPAPEPEPEIASLPPRPLRIALDFPEGARYRIEVTETRQRARDNSVVMAQTSEMDVQMVVKAGGGDGALIEWTYGPATVKTAGDPQAGRLASELGKLIDGQVVAYRTSDSGAVAGLENPGQLVSFYEKSVERALSGIDGEAADAQLNELIRANLTPLLSDEHATRRALDLPKLLHFFNGLEMRPGETYKRDSVMRLPPSAEALPSTLNYELKWFDRAAGLAWLHWRQSVDGEQAAGAMKGYIETLAAQAGKTPPAKIDLGAIDISDSADYEIDLATGFPRQVIYTRTVELFGFTQTEKRRIRVIP